MKTKYLSIVLALMIVVTGMTGIEAKAEGIADATLHIEYTGAGSSGFKANSVVYTEDPTYGGTLIEKKMPGDTITYEVTYKNSSGQSADFYLNSQVAKTLEDTRSATGGAYTYKLTAGTVTLIDSETVGGDLTTTLGLKQVNGSSSDAYFELGTLGNNESGKLVFTIELDGNTQTNSYMDALASIDVRIAAQEKVINSVSNTVTNRSERTVVSTLPGGTQVVILDENVPLSGGPQTGDSIILLIICSIAMIAGFLLVLWYFRLVKAVRKEEA